MIAVAGTSVRTSEQFARFARLKPIKLILTRVRFVEFRHLLSKRKVTSGGTSHVILNIF